MAFFNVDTSYGRRGRCMNCTDEKRSFCPIFSRSRQHFSHCINCHCKASDHEFLGFVSNSPMSMSGPVAGRRPEDPAVRQHASPRDPPEGQMRMKFADPESAIRSALDADPDIRPYAPERRSYGLRPGADPAFRQHASPRDPPERHADLRSGANANDIRGEWRPAASSLSISSPPAMEDNTTTEEEEEMEENERVEENEDEEDIELVEIVKRERQYPAVWHHARAEDMPQGRTDRRLCGFPTQSLLCTEILEPLDSVAPEHTGDAPDTGHSGSLQMENQCTGLYASEWDEFPRPCVPIRAPFGRITLWEEPQHMPERQDQRNGMEIEQRAEEVEANTQLFCKYLEDMKKYAVLRDVKGKCTQSEEIQTYFRKWAEHNCYTIDQDLEPREQQTVFKEVFPHVKKLFYYPGIRWAYLDFYLDVSKFDDMVSHRLYACRHDTCAPLQGPTKGAVQPSGGNANGGGPDTSGTQRSEYTPCGGTPTGGVHIPLGTRDSVHDPSGTATSAVHPPGGTPTGGVHIPLGTRDSVHDPSGTPVGGVHTSLGTMDDSPVSDHVSSAIRLYLEFLKHGQILRHQLGPIQAESVDLKKYFPQWARQFYVYHRFLEGYELKCKDPNFREIFRQVFPDVDFFYSRTCFAAENLYFDENKMETLLWQTDSEAGISLTSVHPPRGYAPTEENATMEEKKKKKKLVTEALRGYFQYLQDEKIFNVDPGKSVECRLLKKYFRRWVEKKFDNCESIRAYLRVCQHKKWTLILNEIFPRLTSNHRGTYLKYEDMHFDESRITKDLSLTKDARKRTRVRFVNFESNKKRRVDCDSYSSTGYEKRIYRKWTASEVDQLMYLYHIGSTYQEIAKILNRSVHSVKGKLKKYESCSFKNRGQPVI
jgi:hypothetical protein